MNHHERGFVFFHNLLTKENSWTIPKDYEEIGDHLITNQEIENQLKSMDEFTFGKLTICANKNEDECLTTNVGTNNNSNVGLINQKITQEPVYITEKNNFTVITESLHNKLIDIGSGALATFYNKSSSVCEKLILTAAHCTTHKDNGK